mmetsp:Transcript_60138/g.162117  ORF Transcript_60138/g.162117 Transcript_60138/m.162117 type:complete len:532 (+) Transcript_60138:116-1711(+)
MTLFGNLRISSKGRQPKDGRRVHPAEEGQGTLAKSPSTNSSEIMVYQDAHHRHNDRKKTADETGLSSRSLRRHPSNGSDDGAITRSAALNMMSHERSVRKALPTLKPGVGVASKKNAQVNLIVVRNPKTWSQGDEDGGAGKPGMISAINEASETCTVYWYETGQVHDHYRIGKKSELCVPHGAIPASLGGDDGLASAGMAQSAMQAMKSLLTGRRAKGRAPSSAPVERSSHRRNSQETYAEKTQTIVIFDWDDTLFPTSFLFDSLRLDLAVPLAQQKRLGARAKEVGRKLAKCENLAVKILQESHMAGQVVLVTLAVKGWVEQACRLFYPKVGELLRQLNIRVVSARQDPCSKGKADVSKGLVRAKCRSEEEYWGLLKGRAISKEIEQFYSQYEGQSWKNVISIGDSQFERYGLLAASTAYIQNKRMSQLDVTPFSPAQSGAWQKLDVTQDAEHQIRLRVKCCKLLVDPDMDELVVEMNTIGKWLTSMVRLDEGFDIDFEALKDVEQVNIVEGVLRGERPVTDLPETQKLF